MLFAYSGKQANKGSLKPHFCLSTLFKHGAKFHRADYKGRFCAYWAHLAHYFHFIALVKQGFLFKAVSKQKGSLKPLFRLSTPFTQRIVQHHCKRCYWAVYWGVYCTCVCMVGVANKRVSKMLQKWSSMYYLLVYFQVGYFQDREGDDFLSRHSAFISPAILSVGGLPSSVRSIHRT